MSKIVALVVLTGAACGSPLEEGPGTTTVYRVPCAIVFREQTANPFKIAQQPNTITPASAAAKPAVKSSTKLKSTPKKKNRKKRKARR